jgi:hypothetical protein
VTVYLGPSSTLYLEEGGEAYHPGDDVPISPESQEMLERFGHYFADSPPPPDVIPTDVAPTALPPVPAPPPEPFTPSTTTPS